MRLGLIYSSNLYYIEFSVSKKSIYFLTSTIYFGTNSLILHWDALNLWIPLLEINSLTCFHANLWDIPS